MRNIIYIIAIAAIFFLAFFILSNKEREGTLHGTQVIENNIQKKLAFLLNNKAENVPLNSLTDFSWKEVCFYGPYDRRSPFEDNDSVNTFVFKFSNSVLFIKVLRSIVDIKSPYYKCYTNKAKLSFSSEVKFFREEEIITNYMIISGE